MNMLFRFMAIISFIVFGLQAEAPVRDSSPAVMVKAITKYDTQAKPETLSVPAFTPGELLIKFRDDVEYGEAFDQVWRNPELMQVFTSAFWIKELDKKHAIKSIKKISAQNHRALLSGSPTADEVRAYCKEIRAEEADHLKSIQ